MISAMVYIPLVRFKISHVVYAYNRAGIGRVLVVHFPGWGSDVCRVFLMESGDVHGD